MPWYDPSWTKRKQIDVAAALVGGDQADFPVLVEVDDDSDLLASARTDGRDIVFTSDDGATKLSHALDEYTPVLERDASYTWFSKPEAVHQDGFTYVGWVDSAGNQKVGQLNHATGIWSTFTLRTSPQVDDHDNVSLFVRPDGRIVAVLVDHSSTFLGVRISTNAHDISTWDAIIDLSGRDTGFSYANFVYLSAEGTGSGRLYLFYRSTNDATRPRAFITSDDLGATWSTKQDAFTTVGERPYMHAVANGTSRIDFVANRAHPTDGAALDSIDLYHWYYEGGSYFKSDGTLIGDASVLPLTSADVTVVGDASVNGAPYWNWDIAVDAGGNPVIVSTEMRPQAMDDNSVVCFDHHYHYHRWTGLAWDSHEVASSSPLLIDNEAHVPNYAPGISLDPSDPSICYVSIRSSQGRRLYRYTTADDGATWTTEQVGYGFRPVVPRGAHVDLSLIYLVGDYMDFNTYDTHIACYPKTCAQAMRLRAWVKVPSVSAASGAAIYAYYGNLAAAAQEDRASIDDASTLLMATGDLSPALIGSAATGGLGALTIEAGFRYQQGTGRQHILSSWLTSQNLGEFILRKALDANHLEGFLNMGAGTTVSASFTDLQITAGADDGFALRYDGSALEGFAGAVKSAINAPHAGDTVTAGAVGVWAGVTPHAIDVSALVDTLYGVVRFVRISDVARSDDWIVATQRMLMDAPSYLTIGVQEAGAGGAAISDSITLTHSNALSASAAAASAESLTLAAALALATTPQATVADVLTIAHTNSLSAGGGTRFLEALTLAHAHSLASTSVLNAAGSLDLNITTLLTATAQVAANAGVSLDAVLSIEMVGEGGTANIQVGTALLVLSVQQGLVSVHAIESSVLLHYSENLITQ